ncbi:MAG: sterol desaturase family protein [Mycobacterium sp.]|uniref:sterol desaturase family protein n=1 Tax=Mycobacterium sp. TaxID=1785 RepID=UPI003BB7816C
MHPSGGVDRPGQLPPAALDSRGDRRAVAGLVLSHAVEMIGLLGAAVVAAGLARSQPGRGAGLATLLLLTTMLLVGWQAYRLLAGRRSLNVSGLTVQSGMLMAAIAVATKNLAAGGIGIGVACSVLAGWGRLAKADPVNHAAAPVPSSAALPKSVQIETSRRAAQIGISGAVLALLTALVVLAALSVRSGIVFGLVVLAVIFIPLERMFALHPRRVLRQGWRTDLVHYLVNGAALKVSLVVAVVAVGGALRVFVPAPLRMAVGASPGWVQIVAGLAIAMVGGYAGHRAAHEVPLLWRFHRVHHSVREMDWLAANHLHPLDETFVRSAAVLPLYALGFGRLSLGAFIVLITLQAIFIHANVRMTFGPLRWVIATPQFHHWHHAREPKAYNTNYAGEFPVLDALFGTLYLPADRWPAQYGIDEVEPAGYLRQLAWPLRTPCAADSEATRPQLVGQQTFAQRHP